MKKTLFSVILAATLVNLSGCAGVVAVGAATTVYAVTDPRSSKELLTDNDISLQAQALGNKPPLQFNVRVNATTYRGDILLMGQAVNQEYKDRITNEVAKIKGVKNIYNQMKVKPLLSISEVSNDVWITTKVKSALVGKDELKGAKVSVYTEDAEVFLVGVVTQQQADFAVEIARNVSGVKRVVKAFYYGESKPVQNTQEKDLDGPAPTQELSDTKPVHVKQATESNTSPSESVEFIQPIEEETFTEQDL
ncbi:BON domain-containing protein [Vibrio hannami]|uniref:BON domain-containing protein n=1 Tax=Vibrio hannami TaxID=2717094 RepID=UPI00241099C8|nr:BON domain-containing protein [Vibrio hannami]MDG3089073.1 BON domain-containing protein [Vibrio hannami]